MGVVDDVEPAHRPLPTMRRQCGAVQVMSVRCVNKILSALPPGYPSQEIRRQISGRSIIIAFTSHSWPALCYYCYDYHYAAAEWVVCYVTCPGNRRATMMRRALVQQRAHERRVPFETEQSSGGISISLSNNIYRYVTSEEFTYIHHHLYTVFVISDAPRAVCASHTYTEIMRE